MRSDHIIGEAIRDFWDIPRRQSEHIDTSAPLSTVLNNLLIDVSIDLHDDPVKSHVSAKITLCLKVVPTVTFSADPPPTLDLQSLYSRNQMTKIAESLSNNDSNTKLSSAWVRFIQSLNIVALNAGKLSEVRKSAIPYLGCPY